MAVNVQLADFVAVALMLKFDPKETFVIEFSSGLAKVNLKEPTEIERSVVCCFPSAFLKTIFIAVIFLEVSTP